MKNLDNKNAKKYIIDAHNISLKVFGEIHHNHIQSYILIAELYIKDNVFEIAI